MTLDVIFMSVTIAIKILIKCLAFKCGKLAAFVFLHNVLIYVDSQMESYFLTSFKKKFEPDIVEI